MMDEGDDERHVDVDPYAKYIETDFTNSIPHHRHRCATLSTMPLPPLQPPGRVATEEMCVLYLVPGFEKSVVHLHRRPAGMWSCDDGGVHGTRDYSPKLV